MIRVDVVMEQYLNSLHRYDLIIILDSMLIQDIEQATREYIKTFSNYDYVGPIHINKLDP